MTEPRDEISSWLDEPVEPLSPPPGTYAKIKRRAAHRRRAHAIAATATAAAVIAGLVAAPRLAVTFFRSGPSAATASAGPAAQPSASPRYNVLPSKPTIMGSGRPIPNDFATISATFIGLKTGLALGTLTTPCATDNGGACLALARTDNTGATWYRVPAPQTGAANAAGGVSQVRFLNRTDGWLFGPDLWWTRDGGNSWQRAGTSGQRVISLEAAGNRAFAVFASCAGPPSAGPGGLTSGCASYQLYSTVAGTADWQRVPGATRGPGSASVVLTQHTGYLVGSGTTITVASGPVAGDGAWLAVGTPCPGSLATRAGPAASASPSSPPAPTSPAAQPATGGGGALLAAAPGSLLAVCSTGSTAAASQTKQILTSGDGGQSWQRRGGVPIQGTAWSAAVNPGGSVFLIAATTGLYISRDGGNSWQIALTGPDGGFGYVGMTDVLQGFAIPAAPDRAGMVLTTDGGQSWFQVGGSP
jgi:hypothetical protein